MKMSSSKSSLFAVISLIAAVIMMSVPTYGVVATDDAYTDTDSLDAVNDSGEVWAQDGRYVNYIRFPVVGGAVDGIAAANITSASLDVWVKKNGDNDPITVYVLDDGAGYFEADYYGPGTDYVGLDENAWTSGSGTNGNMTSTNMPHGPWYYATNVNFETRLTPIGIRVTPIATAGGTDDRDNILGDQVGPFRIPITDLAAFKAAVANDTNGEINLMVVGSLSTNDFRRFEFSSIFDSNTNRIGATLSVQSGTDVTAPSVPENLTVVTDKDGVVDLKWDAVLDADVQSIGIYRGTTSGSLTLLDTIEYYWTAYRDTTVLDDGTTYYYALTAIDDNSNESALSAEVDATPAEDLTPPDPPANVSATAGDKTVTVSWNDSTAPDLDFYKVYRSTTSGSGYAVIATDLTLPSYLDTGLNNGTTYYYVITAVDNSLAANESGFSAEVSASPQEVEGAILFGSNNAGYGGFTTGDPAEVWSLEADSVRYAHTNITVHTTSLLRSYTLDRQSGTEYTIEGIVTLTDGYGDDNNRIGILLFNDTESQTADGGGGLWLRLNTDNNQNITIEPGINGTALASTATGVGDGDAWIGQTLQFKADLVFTNVLGTNLIDVAFTMLDQALNEYTCSAQVEADTYPGTYFGFAIKWRNRGDPNSNRNVPPIIDYRSFYLAGGLPLEGYELWAADFGGTDTIGVATNDYDSDGVDNLNEYALDGDPTAPGDIGYVSYLTADGKYIHAQRSDANDITYTIQTTTDLVTGLWGDATPSVVSTNANGRATDVDILTNTVGTVEDEKFIRLLIEQL